MATTAPEQQGDDTRFPGAVERCSGVDDDCDGSGDEGLACDPPPVDGPGRDRADDALSGYLPCGCQSSGSGSAWIVGLALLAVAQRRQVHGPRRRAR